MSTATKLCEELKHEIELLNARATLSDSDMDHLYRIYSLVWTEACYDPDSEASQKFAQRVLPHIDALNDKLHFKR